MVIFELNLLGEIPANAGIIGDYNFSIKYCFIIEKFQHMYFDEKRWFASNCTFVLVLVHGLENGIEFKVFINIESWVVTDYYLLHRGVKIEK